MESEMDDIETLGVVGAGQMGRGITQVAAQSGYSVMMFDVHEKGLEMGYEFIQNQLAKGVTKGKWDQRTATESLERISKSLDMSDLRDCDMVIEAATENKAIKFEIFRNLDNLIKDEAILASNTSSISITEIAAVTDRPGKIAGMHFMNPVPVMKLVEGIRGLETTEETFNTVETVAVNMGKIFVKANDVPGFAVNRILMPMINEAVYTLSEGVASAEDIDLAMKLGCNQPMGPLELADFIGLDTCLSIMEVLHEGLGDTKYRPCPLLRKYVQAGRLGRKTKKGFFEY
jgi:3-hydroxybutyryl-CoA dehydrogenase